MSPQPAHALRLRAPGCVQGLGQKMFSEKGNQPIGPLARQRARSPGHFLGLGRDFPSPTWAGFAARSMPTARSDRMAALLSRMNKTQVDTLH
jgi:hypothetical protein